eukprot:UN22871
MCFLFPFCLLMCFQVDSGSKKANVQKLRVQINRARGKIFLQGDIAMVVSLAEESSRKIWSRSLGRG